MKKINRKGFTIVELVIVIAVIAILAGVLIPTFSGVVAKSNQSAALQKATSAMKSTLAMSDYGTIEGGTQFILVSGDKVTYKFEYKDNSIGSMEASAALPTSWNAIIVKGTDSGTSGTYNVGSDDKKNIEAALGIKFYEVSANAPKGYYTAYTYEKVDTTSVTTPQNNVTYYTKSGETYTAATSLNEWASGTDYYTRTSEIKIFVNTDYPNDLVTVTKSN